MALVFNYKFMKIKKFLKNRFSKEKFFIFSILFLIASVRVFFEFIPGTADSDWYHEDWKYRQKITTNTSLIEGDHSSFPLLVNTTQNALKSIWSGGRMGQVDAGDLLFTAGDGTTKLSHEIEKYSFSTGELIAWVKIPNLLATGQEIYMYYGNESCPKQWDATGAVWSDRYVAVYHLNDNCASEGCYKDSVKGNNATPYSGDTIANLNDNNGKIGAAVSLDGNREFLKIPDSLDLDLGGNFSIEAYAQLNELNRYNTIFDKGAYDLKVGPDKKYLVSLKQDPNTLMCGENPCPTEFLIDDQFPGSVSSMAEFKGSMYFTLLSDSTYSSIYSGLGYDPYFSVVETFTIGAKIGGLTVFKENLYVYVDDTVYVSSDGNNWSSVYSAPENISSMVVFDNYLYFGTSETGRIYRSLIGTSSWSLANSFASGDMTDVTVMTVYDGKLFVGGNMGKLFLTTNGTNFTEDRDFGIESLITAMGVFDGKLFIALSDAGEGNTYYRNFAGNYTMSNFPEF
jgi:hypothetical protein